MNTSKFFIILPAFAVLGIFAFSSPGADFSLKEKATDKFEQFVADTAQSRVYWECMKHEGFVKLKGGGMMLNGDSIMGAHFTLDMESISDTDIEYELMQKTFENVLKSVVFFNTKAFPNAQFELHQAFHKGNHRYTIIGDFILFDIPMCYDFTGQMDVRGDTLIFNSDPFALNRVDWGIFYLSKNNVSPSEEETFIVSDSITIKLDIKAFKR